MELLIKYLLILKMIKPLPQNKIWKQDNNSDLYGDIWSSFGIDISSEFGKLKTGRTLSVARSINDGTDNYVNGLGLSAAFRFYIDQYFAATDGTISKTGSSRSGVWSLDTTSGKPTTVSFRYSDMEIFNDNLYITVNDTNILHKYTGSVWSNIAVTGQSSSRPHALCVFGSRLYIQCDYAKIQSINTSDTSSGTIGTASSTIDLGNPIVNTITFMRSGLRNGSPCIWIGTLNRSGGKGHIYVWDGLTNSVSSSYKLESSGAMSGIVKDDILYVMDNDGRLLAFNGGTFVEIDRLPIKEGKYLFFALGEYNERWIHPNGMTVKDSALLINISNEYRGNSATYEENVPSGIWEWTKETGLYHKYPLTLTNHDATTLKDYGQHRIDTPGAIAYIKSASTSASDNGSLLVAARLYTTSSLSENLENHILIDDLNDTIEKYSYFITPKIFSEEISETWQKMFLRIKQSIDIVLKYRTEEESPLDINITTWSGSNSIRTDTSITGYGVGDEVEIMQGEGSGRCFTIVSTSDLGGGVTEIVLDSSFSVSGASGKARLQHWKVFKSGDDEILEGSFDDAKKPWIQVKCCINNTGNTYIYDGFITSKDNQKIN